MEVQKDDSKVEKIRVRPVKDEVKKIYAKRHKKATKGRYTTHIKIACLTLELVAILALGWLVKRKFAHTKKFMAVSKGNTRSRKIADQRKRKNLAVIPEE